jgi:hypothetical protein
MEEFASGGLGTEITVREASIQPNYFYGTEIHGLVLLRHRRFDSTNHLVRERCRAVMITGDDLS